jgi:hypothetical protein
VPGLDQERKTERKRRRTERLRKGKGTSEGLYIRGRVRPKFRYHAV